MKLPDGMELPEMPDMSDLPPDIEMPAMPIPHIGAKCEKDYIVA
jgi:hypothetical protein